MIFQLAWRNLWRNRRRTAVILTAIVIGVWSMIFLAGLMRGIADSMVKDGISILTGHIQVQNSKFRNDPSIENFMADEGRLSATLATLPPGTRWTPRIRVIAVANNARHSAGITMVGVDPAREAEISFIGNAVHEGQYLDEESPDGIIVGQALLKQFETRLGNKLVLMSQGTDGEIASRAFQIVGAFRAELESVEKLYVFVTLADAQTMLGAEGSVSEIAVLLDDYRRATEEAEKMKSVISDNNLAVYSWQELLPMVTAVLKMYDGFIFFWFVLVFVAMGFGLVNTILMAVFERIREFGLLRSIGMKPRLVIAEVLMESFYLLTIGIFFGNLLGLLSILALSDRGIDLSGFAAGAEFAGMSRVIIPVARIGDIFLADVTVLLLGILVSLYPAVRASRFSPVEAMTHI